MDNLYLDLQEKVKLLDAALHQLGKRGKTYAEAECQYRMELAKEMLEKREAGLPATILSDVCRGERKIARLRFDRDCAEALYKAALEAINCYKLEIKLLENQIDREYRG